MQNPLQIKRVLCATAFGLVLLAFGPGSALAQNFNTTEFGLGASVQVYPTGVIVGHTANWINDTQHIELRGAYNFAERSENGKHDDEDGGGPGIGAAYHHFFPVGEFTGFYGARLDLWSLEIDWKDQRNGAKLRGSSEVVVLQPTAELGMKFTPDQNWDILLSLSAGAEINVDTDGEDVGEGAIGLAGFSVLRRF